MAEENVSLDNLKQQLFGSLQNSGIVEVLKTQLRTSLLSKLRQPVDAQNEPQTISHHTRIMCSMIVEFLKRAGYSYTLSVFVPECGVGRQLLSREELLQSLHIEDKFTQPSTYTADSLVEIPVFDLMVKTLKDIASKHTVQTSCQTESLSHSLALDDKLRQLDNQLADKLTSERLLPFKSLEERMIKYQRECETRAREEIAAEVQRVRDIEISRMRLEEHARYQKLLDTYRSELNNVHINKLEKLKERERETVERCKQKERDIESASFNHRQQVLRDMESIRTKELEMRTALDLEQRSLQLEKSKFKTQNDFLEQQRKEVEHLRKVLETKTQDDINMFKIEYERMHEDEKREIRKRTLELEDEFHRLRSERSAHIDLDKRFEELKRDHTSLTQEHKALRVEKDALIQETQQLRDQLRTIGEAAKREQETVRSKDMQIKSLQDECSLIRSTLHDATLVGRHREEEQHSMVSRLTHELGDTKQRLQTVLEEQTNERLTQREKVKQAVENEARAWARRMDLFEQERLRFQEQIEQERSLRDDVISENRNLKRELEEVRNVLQNTQHALEVERNARMDVASVITAAPRYATVSSNQIHASVQQRPDRESGRSFSMLPKMAWSTDDGLESTRMESSGEPDAFSIHTKRIKEEMQKLDQEHELIRQSISVFKDQKSSVLTVPIPQVTYSTVSAPATHRRQQSRGIGSSRGDPIPIPHDQQQPFRSYQEPLNDRYHRRTSAAEMSRVVVPVHDPSAESPQWPTEEEDDNAYESEMNQDWGQPVSLDVNRLDKRVSFEDITRQPQRSIRQEAEGDSRVESTQNQIREEEERQQRIESERGREEYVQRQAQQRQQQQRQQQIQHQQEQEQQRQQEEKEEQERRQQRQQQQLLQKQQQEEETKAAAERERETRRREKEEEEEIARRKQREREDEESQIEIQLQQQQQQQLQEQQLRQREEEEAEKRERDREERAREDRERERQRQEQDEREEREEEERKRKQKKEEEDAVAAAELLRRKRVERERQEQREKEERELERQREEEQEEEREREKEREREVERLRREKQKQEEEEEKRQKEEKEERERQIRQQQQRDEEEAIRNRIKHESRQRDLSFEQVLNQQDTEEPLEESITSVLSYVSEDPAEVSWVSNVSETRLVTVRPRQGASILEEEDVRSDDEKPISTVASTAAPPQLQESQDTTTANQNAEKAKEEEEEEDPLQKYIQKVQQRRAQEAAARSAEMQGGGLAGMAVSSSVTGRTGSSVTTGRAAFVQPEEDDLESDSAGQGSVLSFAELEVASLEGSDEIF